MLKDVFQWSQHLKKKLLLNISFQAFLILWELWKSSMSVVHTLWWAISFALIFFSSFPLVLLCYVIRYMFIIRIIFHLNMPNFASFLFFPLISIKKSFRHHHFAHMYMPNHRKDRSVLFYYLFLMLIFVNTSNFIVNSPKSWCLYLGFE